MSESKIGQSKSVAIKSKIFIDECLEQGVLPLIYKHHADFNFIFWPDLALAHLSKDSFPWIEEKFHFVAKDTNLPNVP